MIKKKFLALPLVLLLLTSCDPFRSTRRIFNVKENEKIYVNGLTISGYAKKDINDYGRNVFIFYIIRVTDGGYYGAYVSNVTCIASSGAKCKNAGKTGGNSSSYSSSSTGFIFYPINEDDSLSGYMFSAIVENVIFTVNY